MNGKIIGYSILSFALLFLSACTTPQVAFPEGNSKSSFSSYEVKGRSGLPIFQKISFAGYTAKISRGWTSSSTSSDFFSIETESKSSQKYGFDMSGPNNFKWKGECVSKASESVDTIKIGKFKASSVNEAKSTLKGIFVSGKDKIELKMAEKDGSEKSGTITFGSITLAIQGTKEIEGHSYGTGETCGYYISDKGKLIAVVQVINSGAVYITKDLDESLRPVILTSAMALLAYQDVKKK